jgi:serine/threonine protein kinase
MAQEAGRAVADRYRLIEMLGQGGMGRVWRGHDEVLNRDVAVKQVLLVPDLAESAREMLIKRARREAAAAARLHHPGIVTVHDVVEHEGAPWIVMEYVPGPSLGALIAREGRQDWRWAAELGAQVAEALAHAHATGVIHRDLKPDNILMAGSRSIITDFGIARINDATRLTSTHTLVGTPQYMSPEQFEGREATRASDLWALGATLYATVEGHPPFEGETLTAIITAVLTRPLPPAEHAGPLAEFLTAMLAKDHHQRPDAAAIARHLRAIATHTAEAPPSTPGEAGQSRQGATAVLPAHPDGQGASRPGGPSRRAVILGGLGLSVVAIGATVMLINDKSGGGDSIVMTGHTDAVFSVAFSPDGKTLASGSRDTTIRLWNLASHTQRASLAAGAIVNLVAYSPDGKTLAGGAGPVKLWDAATLAHIATFTSNATFPSDALSIAFSPDGQMLADGGESLELWSLASHAVIASMVGGGDPVAFSPDGKTLASSDNFDTGNYARLWSLTDLPDPASQILVEGDGQTPAYLGTAAFSPDGKTLATGGFETTIQLWNPTTQTVIAVLAGHTDEVLSVAFSPDGKILASGGRDSTVRLWDTATYTQIAVLTGHSQFVESVAFSPDGATLASGSGDTMIRLWPIADFRSSQNSSR